MHPIHAGLASRVIAATLAAVNQRHIRRPIINPAPRHLKSHLASIAFPAWCLGHNPGVRMVCFNYAQDLAAIPNSTRRHGAREPREFR